MKKSAIKFFLLFLLSSCSIIYRPDIQQGNILKQSTIEQLKLGMTEEQVRYLLGGSSVLQMPFQSSSKNKACVKEYFYFYQPGHAQSIKKRLSLLFLNNKLAAVSKDAS